ncbi:MAG: glycosyltransferase family 4 protein [Kiritimatiellae bacterium]|nr:glycosyltransferase family 4 protein [Kiritimatiellia bacterium]
MKVLYLATSFSRRKGDAVVPFLYELALSLAKLTEVMVITPNSPGSNTEDFWDGFMIKRFNYFVPASSQRVVFPDGIPVQLKKSLLAKIQAPFFILCFLLNTIKASRKADVLLCNWALTGFLAMINRILSRKPYVVIVRGSDLGIMEKGGILGRLFISALKRADAVCAVAINQVTALTKLGVRDVAFVPNGINWSEFGEHKDLLGSELGLGDSKIVLFVGSLIDVKGVRYLIEAMSGINAKLVIVGDGYLLDDLREMARRLSVDTVFLGRISRTEIPKWFAVCDVFVLPSLSEGRPNVLIEALASGKACVASDIPGTRELIQNGENGFLTPPEDSEALKEKIKLLLENGELRGSFEGNAKESIADKVHTWDLCAKSYETILKRVVETTNKISVDDKNTE